MPCLMKKWQETKIDDKEFTPLIECFVSLFAHFLSLFLDSKFHHLFIFDNIPLILVNVIVAHS